MKRGERLGPYETIESIGAGGMGEVWKARDSRLDRLVAVKVSKDAFSERFEREARAVAALNHPYICQIYDVGPNYLVMEYIEGTPLKGPLPIEKAVEYAGQILEALEAAHRKGITHRDLKPANILVTEQGIKLLDFGLAKQIGGLRAGEDTVTQTLTSQGQILGTVQYMAPEQLHGKGTDARADLFSFGCVLYEMLTGKRAYDGESPASVIAAILERPAPSLADVAPTALDRVLRVCLAKNPEERWQSARDLRQALDVAGTAVPAARPQSRRSWIWPAATGLLALALAAFGWLGLFSRPAAEEARPLHFEINPPAGTHFLTGVGGGSAISPDGRTIAFVAVSSGVGNLWIRSLDFVIARELAGTEGAQFPFWSPDSRSLAFFARGKLKRLEIAGGRPVVIADIPGPRGGTWNAHGDMLIADLSGVSGLKRVPAVGGAPVALNALSPVAESVAIHFPRFLPDGRRFLYTVPLADSRVAGIYVATLDRSGQNSLLTDSTSAAAYSPPRAKHPGYLLSIRSNALMAQPFDPDNAKLVGQASPVPGGEVVGALGYANRIPFSVSNEGKLLISSESDRYQLTWFSRDGKVMSTLGQPDRYAAVRLSPEGQRAATTLIDSSGNRDIWRLEFARGVQGRVTVNGHGFVAVWSPEGRRLAFHDANRPKIQIRDASGASPEETILQSEYPVYVNDWSPDGRYVLYTETRVETGEDLWLVPTTGDRKPEPFLKTPFNESHGQFSPDGKWVAYTSDESGQSEIYVQSRTAGEFKRQISNGGGSFPRWRGDGKELFYRALDGNLMAASVRAVGRGLEVGTATALFRITEPLGTFAYPYDVAPDGQRILALAPAEGRNSSPPLILLVNWEASLKR